LSPAGVLFLRFQPGLRVGLFAAFAAAFRHLAPNQALAAPSQIPREEQT